MIVTTFSTVKCYRNFFSHLKIYVTTAKSCASKFTSAMTMVSIFFIAIINEFFTNVTGLELIFFFFSYDQIFVKIFFYYFFTIAILFKNCFNKFISSIFTPKNNNRLPKSIIKTNNFVSKITRNMTMGFF